MRLHGNRWVDIEVAKGAMEDDGGVLLGRIGDPLGAWGASAILEAVGKLAAANRKPPTDASRDAVAASRDAAAPSSLVLTNFLKVINNEIDYWGFATSFSSLIST